MVAFRIAGKILWLIHALGLPYVAAVTDVIFECVCFNWHMGLMCLMRILCITATQGLLSIHIRVYKLLLQRWLFGVIRVDLPNIVVLTHSSIVSRSDFHHRCLLRLLWIFPNRSPVILICMHFIFPFLLSLDASLRISYNFLATELGTDRFHLIIVCIEFALESLC